MAPCPCGLTNPIPSLSQLRKEAGQAAYPSAIIDIINRMLDDRELPWGDKCAVSGTPTNDVMLLAVQCEIPSLPHIRRGGFGWAWQLLLSLCLLPFGLIRVPLPSPAEKNVPLPDLALGHEGRVRIPLRVRRDHWQLVFEMSQEELRKLLATVPVYAKLLNHYPQANISALTW